MVLQLVKLNHTLVFLLTHILYCLSIELYVRVLTLICIPEAAGSRVAGENIDLMKLIAFLLLVSWFVAACIPKYLL